ncbi:MAG: anthranilate synthase component I family protein [Saprospiraceae bacterium]
MRQYARFPVKDLAICKRQLLAWADAHPVAVYLDSNTYPNQTHHTWECLVAVGGAAVLQANSGQAFADLKRFYDEKQDWLFGFFGYDLKNEVEKLRSDSPDAIGLPDLFFFQPETVVGIRGGHSEAPGLAEVEFFSLAGKPDSIWQVIQNAHPVANPETPAVSFEPRFSLPEYLATVEAVRQHIIAGDVYEMNLCQEFFAEGTRIEPAVVFERLNKRTRAPFAAYFRLNHRYLMCASPERFLRKEGQQLVSQPIKGTRRRHADPAEDERAREDLRSSEKDRAENVMIVDLVRNDLARNCLPGSVRVDELFGIYSFQTVNQMISTVSGTLQPGTHPVEAIRDAFPMGSMTGAPKVMAMHLIEQYEQTRRGLYSGALGYFAPDGDFDFNVVIRSLLYNAESSYLSCQVGGAIVYDSVPEQEYEECMVKVGALLGSLDTA